MLGLTYVAEVWGELTLTAAIGQVWILPFLAYLVSTDVTKVNKWVIWTVTSLLLSYPNGISLVTLVF
jgi:MFS transporter, ACS family, DAL5 transporter family protein